MVAVGLVAWVVWPENEPVPRQREYRAETACLLTDDQGVAGQQAASVWAGMQEASVATLVKVQYLEVDGPQTAANAETFLASLTQSKCDLVLTVGDAPVAALRAGAPRFPNACFVAFGAASPTDNVSVVAASDGEDARRKAKELVEGLADVEG